MTMERHNDYFCAETSKKVPFSSPFCSLWVGMPFLEEYWLYAVHSKHSLRTLKHLITRKIDNKIAHRQSVQIH